MGGEGEKSGRWREKEGLKVGEREISGGWRERYQDGGERGVWISSCDNTRWRTEYWINFRVHESFREPTLADCMYPSPLLC